MWSHTLHDPALTVWERLDRRGVVYARWWRRTPRGGGYWAKTSLRRTVRDPESGLVDPALEREVLRLAGALHRDLVAGISPGGGEPELTLARGLALFLAPAAGAFALATRRQMDLRRAAQVLKTHLGADTTWRALGADAGPAVWRAMAREGRGRAWTECVVGCLYQAADWLRTRTEIPAGACPRLHGWRRALRQDWRVLTDSARRPLRDEPPARYTLAELRALLACLDRVDPRLRLVCALALEGRLGQAAAHLRRRDCDLSATGTWGCGRIRIAGTGCKGGMIIDLDESTRQRLEEELSGGLLAEFEALFQLGRITDYALIPAGTLRQGRIPWRGASTEMEPWSRASLARAWRALERAARVPHIPGRGPHGARRTLVDVAIEETDQSVLLDGLGGWQPGSGVRERTYLARDRAVVQAQIAHLRRAVRQRVALPARGGSSESGVA